MTLSPCRTILTAAALLLAGCASASHQWVQEGKTQDDAAAALAFCEQSVPEPPPEPPLYLPRRTFPNYAVIDKCMTERGYKLVPKE